MSGQLVNRHSLYVGNTNNNNTNNNSYILYANDGALKIYSQQSELYDNGPEAVVLQTTIDGQDPTNICISIRYNCINIKTRIFKN